jgi:hypothetical protein
MKTINVANTTISCGVYQLQNLDSDSSVVVQQVANDISNRITTGENTYAFLLFSDAVIAGNGASLAKYIKEKKLGSIVASRVKINPNSENKIKVWIWGVNRNNLFKFLKMEIPEYNDDEDYDW